MTKADLRKYFRNLRSRISLQDAERWSRQLADDLIMNLRLTGFDGVVFLYAAMPGEPDLLPYFHNQRYHMALPRISAGGKMTFHLWAPSDNLDMGPLKIMEPAASAPEVIPVHGDVAVIPALAVDNCGVRLGFGGGYYDRWLAENRTKLRFSAAAVFPPCIAVDSLPCEAHDIPVDFCLKTSESV